MTSRLRFHVPRRGRRAALALALAATTGLAPPIDAAQTAVPADAMAATKAVIEVFLTVQDPPEGGQLNDAARAANCKAYEHIDRYFGFDLMFDAAIGPNKKRLTAVQLAGLKRDFLRLIRQLAYPKSGSLFRGAEYRLQGPRTQGDTHDVIMDAYIPDEDIDTRITYHWQRIGDAWRVTDISFDGDSLVLDYRNQFTRLINEHGVQGFLDKVHKKVVEAEQKGNGC